MIEYIGTKTDLIMFLLMIVPFTYLCNAAVAIAGSSTGFFEKYKNSVLVNFVKYTSYLYVIAFPSILILYMIYSIVCITLRFFTQNFAISGLGKLFG